MFALPALIGAGWLIAIGAQATGTASLLHHHALIEGGPPLWIGVPLFLVGWQVMIAAMMLPASLHAVQVVDATIAGRIPPQRARAAFLAGFAAVWTAFGLLAFTGDVALHRVVDATPWLAARPWLIEATVLALAGGYQLTPRKRRSLAACRHPVGLLSRPAERGGPFMLGLGHGLDCLESSWAQMLLMFAEGFANLWWMAALTALMWYEARGQHGHRAAGAAGLVLLVAAMVAASGSLPLGA